MERVKEYNLYKGLQKPLVFRAFKGKFIYYGIGSIVLGLIGAMVVGAMTSMLYGIIILIFITGGGLTYTAIMQQKGLHSKNVMKGVYMIQHTYKHNKNVKKETI